MAAFREHGKDYKKISQAVGTKSHRQVKGYTWKLKKQIKRNPDTEGADVLPLLLDACPT